MERTELDDLYYLLSPHNSVVNPLPLSKINKTTNSQITLISLSRLSRHGKVSRLKD
tara:strand:- start:279 stop:446 length:168 start_codon:yes stop_codon:yes gene_type:complete